MCKLSHLVVTLVSALCIILAGCGPAATPTPQPSIPLEGTEWVLSSLGGDDPVPGVAATLGFYPDRYMEGTAGCNSFGVDYTATGPAFQLAEIHRTSFDCAEPAGLMAQDRAFFEALARIAAYTATEDRLEFRDAEGETLVAYDRKRPPVVDPALLDTEWLLISLRGEDLVTGSRITLNLSAEGFGGIAGCNNYGGEFETASQGSLRFGLFSVTAMDCPGLAGVMGQEQAYIQALTQARAYRLSGDRLELQDELGETTLVYTGKQAFDTDPAALVGTAWRLLSLDGVAPPSEQAVTLIFYSDSMLGGHGGCRDYLASYEMEGDNLHTVYEVMFDVDCPVDEGDLGLDAGLLDAMAPKADLKLGPGSLEIHGERGSLLLLEPLPEEASSELEGPTWLLMAMVGPNPWAPEPEPWPVPIPVLPGATVDLTLAGGAAQGTGGCNGYGGTYTRDGASLRFENLAHTEMACLDPAGIMEQEANYLQLLAAASSYQVHGQRLWLESLDGQALVFFAPGR